MSQSCRALSTWRLRGLAITYPDEGVHSLLDVGYDRRVVRLRTRRTVRKDPQQFLGLGVPYRAVIRHRLVIQEAW